MLNSTTLDKEGRSFVEEVAKVLAGKRSRISPSRLVALTSLAFQRTFASSSREDKLANALARGLSVREKMAAAEGGNMSAEETARYLGVTKQSVLNLYHGGKLLGWKTAKQGAIRFPVWQFSQGERLPGLNEVLDCLNSVRLLDDWGKIGFFLESQEGLKGKRPLDLLRENQTKQVLKAAAGYVQ
jgi:hypothetical protein